MDPGALGSHVDATRYKSHAGGGGGMTRPGGIMASSPRFSTMSNSSSIPPIPGRTTTIPSYPLGMAGDGPPRPSGVGMGITGAGGASQSQHKGSKPEDFERMVGDLRLTFIGWLKKTESDLHEARGGLQQEREAFEEEKARWWRQALADIQAEHEKIKGERRKAEAEVATGMKQLQIEQEDVRRKLRDEQQKVEAEKEQHRRQLLLEREKFKQEYEAFDIEKRRIVDASIVAETQVEIDVGGVVFGTARHTVTRQPGSYLESLFSGRHEAPRDRHGRIRLDRDAELFRTILNFLRNPTKPPQPRDATESENLCTEAEFYGVRFFPFPLVYACGGHDGFEHLRATELLDVGQQCWRPVAPMQTERLYFASAQLHNRLYLYGGQNLDYKALAETEVYDCLRDTWMRGQNLIVPRRNACGIAENDRIFAIGGFDGSQIISSVEAYDPRIKNWMDLAPLITPRSSAFCTSRNGVLYVMGGTNGVRLRTVEVYDTRMNKWEELGVDMIEVRSAGCACCSLNHLYAIGGTDNSNAYHASMEVSDPDCMTWAFRKNMSTPRMDCAAVVISDSIMVGGGQNGEVLGCTEFYSAEVDEWQAGPAMRHPRYGHAYLSVTL